MKANLRQADEGLVPEGDGWFVVNAHDAAWIDDGPFGFYCAFEGDLRFPQLGVNITVLQPGQSVGRYHAEPGHQEDFLVLAGRCVLIVEDNTRDLVQWDFFHCPPGTPHTIVGAGEAPSVVLAVGTRGAGDGVSPGAIFPRSDVAAAHGVSVLKETTEPREAYADVPQRTARRRLRYREGWLPSWKPDRRGS